MSNRSDEWNYFSNEVHDHIEQYTVPQYGDAPDDLASSYSKADIDNQLRKYVTRQCNGGNKRGHDDNMRDYIKIAHYACMAYAQMKNKKV